MRKRITQSKNEEAALKSRFGTIVREFRRQLGITQEEMAWRADMHRTYLADIERGQRNVCLTNIIRIVRALEVPSSEFFRALDHGVTPTAEAPRRSNGNGRNQPKTKASGAATKGSTRGR